MRAEPNTQTAGPSSPSVSKPWRSSCSISASRSVVGARRGDAGRSAQMISSSERGRGSGVGRSLQCQLRVRGRDYLREFAWKRPKDHNYHSTHGGDGTVRALDDRIVIEPLTVDDARAARVVRERAEAGQAAGRDGARGDRDRRPGARARGHGGQGRLRAAEFEAGPRRAGPRLGGTLEEGAEELAERIAATFGAERDGSVQAQIKEIVTAEARQQREQLLAHAHRARTARNPLVAIQVADRARRCSRPRSATAAEVERAARDATSQSRAMQTQVAELQGDLARMLDKDEHERSPRPRRPAPARASASRSASTRRSSAIAAARGDLATHTGGEQAEGGGKKGDTLVEIGACDGRRRRGGSCSRPRTSG